MICPHCQQDIPDSAVAKHLAAKGGRKSRGTITPEQQAKMQAARKAKKGDKP
jgi:hypothetical protein